MTRNLKPGQWFDSQIQLERERLRSALTEMMNDGARILQVLAATPEDKPVRLPDQPSLSNRAVDIDLMIRNIRGMQELKENIRRMGGTE